MQRCVVATYPLLYGGTCKHFGVWLWIACCIRARHMPCVDGDYLSFSVLGPRTMQK